MRNLHNRRTLFKKLYIRIFVYPRLREQINSHNDVFLLKITIPHPLVWHLSVHSCALEHSGIS